MGQQAMAQQAMAQQAMAQMGAMGQAPPAAGMRPWETGAGGVRAGLPSLQEKQWKGATVYVPFSSNQVAKNN